MIQRIEIDFPVPVQEPETFSRDLHALLEKVCEEYQRTHPSRVMWVFGVGCKQKWSKIDAAFLGKAPEPDAPESGEPQSDDTILHFEIAEREDFHGNNPHNPAIKFER